MTLVLSIASMSVLEKPRPVARASKIASERAALLPFREEAPFTRPGWHGLFEFEFGVRFIRAGGRKATLVSEPAGHAAQIKCDSSSTVSGPTR